MTGSLSGNLRNDASHCLIWEEIFPQTLQSVLRCLRPPKLPGLLLVIFILAVQVPKRSQEKGEKTRTSKGHLIPEAMPDYKEVTSPTVAGFRHIHLSLDKAYSQLSTAMQTVCDLHLSGSAVAVPTSLKQPLPALFPTLMIIQLGSMQHLVWDSGQRAYLSPSLARTRVLIPAPC